MAASTHILKVFSLTSLSTLVRMCAGFVSVKVVANVIGPAGVALLGQLNNFSEMTLTFATGGIGKGVTKYVAEHREEPDAIKRYLSAALRITVGCSLLCSIILIAFSRRIAEAILLSSDYGYVFTIFGFTVLLFAINSLLLSIVNGYKEFRRYVAVSIAGSIVSVCVTVTLVLCFRLAGALIAAVTFQSVALIFTLLMLRNAGWLKLSNFSERLRRPEIKAYGHFALMTIVTALCVPVAQMLLRGYVMTEISETEAGWWEAMNRLSAMWLMVITSSFSVYYLPKLSELRSARALRSEIAHSFRVIAPMLLVGFAVIYLLRYFIIRLVFSPEFMPMSSLFGWQMAGDFFKISSWLIAYVMVAKAMTRMYVVTEIISTAIYLALGYTLVRANGITGLCQAHMINYIIYTATMLLIFSRLYRRNIHQNNNNNQI